MADGESEQPNTVQSTSSAITGSEGAIETLPCLPTGLKLPQPLNTKGNLATNWKRFKRAWDNYAIVARITRFEKEFQTATFLSVIGEEALEIYEGLELKEVLKKFEEFCIGETNDTYERFVFNRRDQENDSIDQYVTTLRKLLISWDLQFLQLFV